MLTEVFCNDREPSSHAKSLGTDPDDGAKLVPFVFTGIDQFQGPFYQRFIKPSCNDVCKIFPPFNVEIEDPIEYIIFR